MLELTEPRDDARVVHEEPGVLGDVIDDVLDRGNGILERLEARRRQSHRVVVELADIAIQRFGDLDALASAGRLRGAAQRMAGAMQILGDRIRRIAELARRNELTNGREMARGFFGEDFVQDGIHRRRVAA